MDLSGSDSAISNADLILALECRNVHEAMTKMQMPLRGRAPLANPDAKIIQVGSSDLFIHSTVNDFQALMEVDVSIGANAANTLPYLIEECQTLVSSSPNMKSVIDARFERVSSEHNQLRTTWKEDAKKKWSNSPMSLARVASEVWDAIKGEDWVLAAGRLGYARWERRFWEFTKPYQYLGGSAGGGLGYNLPAAIGVALANRGTGRMIVDLQPDGDLLYVTSSLWTAVHHNLPILIVLLNNKAYYNDFMITKRLAEKRGRSSERAEIGNDIDNPVPDYVKIAESFGAKGIGPITEPDQLGDALKEAVTLLKSSTVPVLVDVSTERSQW